MVREFDERNLAKSRERCAAMAEVANTGKRVLTERERAILDMWPRFEDTGDPVMVGGAYIDGSGDCNIIVAVRICDVCVDLVGEDGFLTGFKPGERVKRPAPEALDADGVEIKVGDTVYDVRGERFTVTDIEGGLLGLSQDGFIIGSWMPADQFSISLRDSWERLEEDAAKYPCLYAEDVKGSKFDSCSDCPWHSECGGSREREVMARYIVRRAKALAGVEVAE